VSIHEYTLAINVLLGPKDNNVTNLLKIPETIELFVVVNNDKLQEPLSTFKGE